MKHDDVWFDEERAISLLLDLIAVEGTTGKERAIAEAVETLLIEAGVAREFVFFDKANDHFPEPRQTGNLIAQLPGTIDEPRRLFVAHLDTVPSCANSRPWRSDDRILNRREKTALGGDNRAGVACLITMIENLLKSEIQYPPLTVLFTVREESGMLGSRFADLDDLGEPHIGFNADGGDPTQIVIGGFGAKRWEAKIFGRAAHASLAPEQGISATMVAAHALSQVRKDGWFGRIEHDGKTGTSNVGGIVSPRCSMLEVNVIADFAGVYGESRSRDLSFVDEITEKYRRAFEDTAKEMANDEGEMAEVEFNAHLDYKPFELASDCPAVSLAREAARRSGWEPGLMMAEGGMDANWLVQHGIPTITFGVGQRNVHSNDEYVDLKGFLRACRYGLALATQRS